MSAPVRIRPIEPCDHPQWREMWAGYQAFYEVALDAATTQALWSRLFDPASGIRALVAEQEGPGAVIGLCHYILHANTWEIAPVCYLQDLYVQPGERARGVGAAMIERLRSQMADEGWSRIYWMTREDNYRARGLYDRYAKRDAFVRYVVRATG
ncbi:MAG: GNAT family N-acetyltransferase [bacterium]|jgi:GNAT superfamily N-acetyltransferase|nr:GNAT family N-acetyltransferase [Betaproteobacteria bacterium]